MSRHPAPVHAIPLDAGGLHVPSSACRCRPTQATDLLEPSRIVVVHRDIREPNERRRPREAITRP